MANINQLMRRQSSREMVHRQFSRDIDARLEMSMMGDFYHGRRIHYSGGSFKMRARSKSEIPSRQRKHMRDKLMPDYGDEDDEPTPLTSNELPVPTKQVHLLPPIPSEKELGRVETATSFVQPTEGDEGHVESWDSKLTYMLATVGYAVGLGNVWRFPYLAQKNGGGAFLIPYFIMLMILGLPLFILELAIGQRLRKGAIGAWQRISPWMGGVGIASGVVSLTVGLYYNTVIAWCLYYFGKSFQSPLPWAECPKTHFPNNLTYVENHECLQSSPTQYFWYRETLDISDSIETSESFNWTIGACLLLSWVLVYICIIKGITENPIIIYITAIYPYVVLIIFFIRALTLPGMGAGIAHLFTPKWEKLLEPGVWLDAGTQIFFSLGLAFGSLIAYSSYNPANNQCIKDGLFVAVTNCSTSLFAGIVIFAIMGFKAHTAFENCQKVYNTTLMTAFSSLDLAVIPEDRLIKHFDNDSVLTSLTVIDYTDPITGIKENVPLKICNLQNELDKSASGTGLAFILFTEAVNQFPLPNLWAIFFFAMLLCLGLDSQFGMMQSVVQCMVDLKLFPNAKKEYMTGGLCIFCFFVSLCFSHQSGNYIFTLFDNYSGNIPLLMIAFMECVGVVYFYGIRTLARDIELMTGSKPSMYWMICWKFVSPLAMLVILISSFVSMFVSGAGYDAWIGDLGNTIFKPWPWWAALMAIFLIGISALWILVIPLLRLCGINLLPEEPAGWFPEPELKEFYSLGEYEDSKLEKALLGHQKDGREGLIFPMVPPYVVANALAKNEEDEEEGGINMTARED